MVIADLARRYCALIERCDRSNVTWLVEIAELLPRLQAAVWSLGGRKISLDLRIKADLDARFELYSRLVRLLGERDGYCLEFDRGDNAEDMTGSLADDLTDIYCELKSGLELLAADPQWAASGWLTGYAHHWGQHLVDAERHLAALSAEGRLP